MRLENDDFGLLPTDIAARLPFLIHASEIKAMLPEFHVSAQILTVLLKILPLCMLFRQHFQQESVLAQELL